MCHYRLQILIYIKYVLVLLYFKESSQHKFFPEIVGIGLWGDNITIPIYSASTSNVRRFAKL
jgi:hypothetical protein